MYWGVGFCVGHSVLGCCVLCRSLLKDVVFCVGHSVLGCWVLCRSHCIGVLCSV